jgi:hypothetical protein
MSRNQKLATPTLHQINSPVLFCSNSAIKKRLMLCIFMIENEALRYLMKFYRYSLKKTKHVSLIWKMHSINLFLIAEFEQNKTGLLIWWRVGVASFWFLDIIFEKTTRTTNPSPSSTNFLLNFLPCISY